MTFERREPSFDGAHRAHQSTAPGSFFDHGHAASSHAKSGAGLHGDGVGARAGRLARLVATVQVVGSLLAVPLGLASGYSIYRANFAPETTCQNLRTSIIGMLDKSVDAATRRMLVRRDVQAFEERCGSVDPDAHAAFKALLAEPAAAAAPRLRAALPASEAARKPEFRPAPKPETKAVAKVEPKPEFKPEPKAESKPEPKPEPKTEAKAELKPETNPEPRAVAVAKPAATAPAAAPAEAAPVDGALSDTRWLAAVRQALVTHEPPAIEPVAAAPGEAAPKALPGALPSALPMTVLPARADAAPADTKSAGAKPAAPVLLQPTWNVIPPPPDLAPQSEPPAVASGNEAAAAGTDSHPVPPAAIPESEAKEPNPSKLGSWVAQIPFVGRVIEPRGN